MAATVLVVYFSSFSCSVLPWKCILFTEDDEEEEEWEDKLKLAWFDKLFCS